MTKIRNAKEFHAEVGDKMQRAIDRVTVYKALHADLTAVIDKYRGIDVPLAGVVGVLEIVKQELIQETKS